MGTRPAVSQLRLQLLASAQDASVLGLLRMLAPLVSWAHAKPRVRWWARGWAKGGRVPDVEALVRMLSHEVANEIEIDFGVSAPYAVGGGLTIHSLRCTLTMSPTNRLWADVSGFTLPDREDEARRASYESRAQALRWNEISTCPTLSEALFEVDARDPDRILRSFWEAMPGTLPDALSQCGVLGCVDFHDPLAYRGDVLEVLAPWPRSYPLLGARFDDLHPILLGPLTACEGLATALGGGARLRRIAATREDAALGLIWSPMALVADERSRQRAQAWLVPRDSSTSPRALDASRGEFRVGRHVVYTQRRHAELQQQGCLSTLPPGFRYFPLVSAKYCARLGIDADEMLVELWQEPLIEKAQREIDAAFDVSSSDVPLIDRVWRAHEAIYRKWLYGPDERLRFVKDRLYAAHSHR